MNWKTLGMMCCVAALAVGCKSTAKTDDGGNYNPNGTDNSGRYPADALTNPNNILSKRGVYFDFDSSAIRSEFRPLIEAHSGYLKAYPSRGIQIQGNTDARGSREYNIGLGQRRSESVRQAFMLLGIPSSQLEAVSFGKERPRALGNTEADHAENRRADMVYDGEAGRE